MNGFTHNIKQKTQGRSAKAVLHSMSNRATISERFVKERYIVSHLDKRNILPMVQMKIYELNPKVLTKKKVEKPDLLLKPCREGQEIQKQYMIVSP